MGFLSKMFGGGNDAEAPKPPTTETENTSENREAQAVDKAANEQIIINDIMEGILNQGLDKGGDKDSREALANEMLDALEESGSEAALKYLNMETSTLKMDVGRSGVVRDAIAAFEKKQSTLPTLEELQQQLDQKEAAAAEADEAGADAAKEAAKEVA
jgi:flagellar hook-basal body complex protein FliE